MPERKRPRVGEILVEAGIIDQFQLRAALGEQTRWGRPLGATLIKLGFVEEPELVRALASQLGLPMATLDGKRIPSEILALVPRDVAEKSMVIPLFVKREGGRSFLYLGVEDPGALEVFDDLSFRTGMEIKPVMVGPSELCEAIDRCYARDAESAETRPPSPPVTPGTEELARHWSQGDDTTERDDPPAQPAPEMMSEPMAEPVEELTHIAPELLREVSDESTPSPAQAVPIEDTPRPAPPARAPESRFALQALATLLIEKGVMTREEIQEKIRDLELMAAADE